MLRNLTLGKRIASGIVLMLVLMMVVGAGGYYGLSRVSNVMGLYRDINGLQGIMASLKEQSDGYMLALFRDHEEAKKQSIEKALALLKEGADRVAQLKGNSALGQKGNEKFTQAEEALREYSRLFDAYLLAQKEKGKIEGEIIGIHEALLNTIKKCQLWFEEVLMACEIVGSHATSYLNRPSEKNWNGVEEGQAKLKAAIAQWMQKVSNSEELAAVGKEMESHFMTFTNSIGQYRAQALEQDRLTLSMNKVKENLYAIFAELGAMSERAIQEQATLSNRVIFGVILASLLIGLCYAFVSIKRIVGKLNNVITGITEGADQVSSASDQVASSSQNLAEGSSHQAAFIEETSSSLEEISSMVKQNAGHAAEAKGMMADVNRIVEKVSDHMADMTKAIDEITLFSQETDKIVKTIDEIAFQTNLLALNAAVEAARAGEAGAGFAVVADEVRNLAMRAAEAAKNTAQLIGDTIKAVKNGSGLTIATKESFEENIRISSKVGALVDEIAEASREQAEGIEQVSKAVAEMERVTQQNAAGAEESASAAEEMNAQAESMKEYVGELIRMVHGGGTMEKGAEKALNGPLKTGEGSHGTRRDCCL